MSFVQRTNPEGKLIQSNGVLSANNRNISAQFYDSTQRTLTFTTTSTYLQTTKFNSAPTVFVASTNHLQVTKAGLFHINWHTTLKALTADSGIVMWVEIDSTGAGSSFAESSGTKSFLDVPMHWVSFESSGNFHLGAGYLVRVRYKMEWGTASLQTLGQGDRLGIICLYLLGDS